MPPAIIAAVATAAGVTGTIGGLSIATLIGEGVTLGGIFALGLLVKPKAQHPTAGQMETTKQPLPPRVRVYGRVMSGGALYFQAAPYILQKGIYFCEGPIDSFQEVWLGDSKTFFQPGDSFHGADIFPWFGFITLTAQTGTVPQSRNPALAYPWWDTSHAGNGLANIVMTCLIPFDPKENFKKFYPSGVPALRAVLHGSKIFDPRDGTQVQATPSTWKFSDNPALCVLDFLTSTQGYNIPYSNMDVASFTAMANLCDVLVTRPDTTTEKRYRCWGSYQLTEEPSAVLKRLLSTCDGEITQKGDGTIAIQGGQFDIPDVTITQSMILGYEIKNRPDKMSGFNQYRVHYTEQKQDFQLIESKSFNDTDGQTLSGGQVISQSLELPFVPSDWQARRLAKIYMAQNNPEWMLTVVCSIAALNALGSRIVAADLAELGINTTFLVKKFDISADLATCTLELSSLTASAYVDPDAYTGSGLPPPAPKDPIPTPTGLSASQITISGGKIVAKISGSVSVPTDQSYELHAQISKDGGATWKDMITSTLPGLTYTALSDVIDAGIAHSVRAALRTPAGVDGTFTSPVIVAADTVTLPISQGGTGSTTSTGARASLEAAKSGINTDITGISGLSTANPIVATGAGKLQVKVTPDGTNFNKTFNINSTSGRADALLGQREFQVLWTARPGSTTVDFSGLDVIVDGDATALAVSSTNYVTQIPRVRYSPPSGGVSAGVRGGSLIVWRGNAANLGGFYFTCRFAVEQFATNMRLFVGLWGTVGVLVMADPSSKTNIVGIGCDAGDTVLQLFTNDGAGTATKTSFGTNFPANTSNADMYDFTMSALPNDTKIHYILERIATAFVSEGDITSNLPANTAFMTPNIQVELSNVVRLVFSSMYIEIPVLQ